MAEPKKDQAPGTLLEAILAVQGEIGTLKKDATNPAFRSKYVTLDSIVEQVQPVLTKHGLVWMTFPTEGSDDPSLQYVLTHVATGQSMDGVMPLLLGKRDMQGFGSALTYARRYSICAVLNLVADEDDDGNAAQAPKPADLARAKSRMTDKAKALADEARSLFERPEIRGDLTAEQFNRYLDSTGYTEEGLQRLVGYLKEHAPNA